MSSSSERRRRVDRPHLSLAHKALVLLAVPLFLQIALVALLAHVHSQAEQEARQAERARQISETANAMMKDAYAIASLIMDSLEHGVAVDPALIPQVQDFEEDSRQLKKLLGDDPRSLAILDEVTGATKSALALTRDVSGNLDVRFPSHSQQRKNIYRQLRRYGHHVARLTALQQENRQIAEGSPLRQAQYREKVKTTLVLFTILDVVAVLLVGFYFTRHIFRRLDVLIENSRRLAAGQPLAPRLPGADEVARIDSAFHNMAETLSESARFRQEVLQMVSHDLRTPLSTVQSLITMAEDGMLGQINERGQRLLAVADRNVQHMITLINDLLDIEKIESGSIHLEKADVPVSSIFEQAEQAVMQAAQARGVAIEIATVDLVAYGDGNRLVQVLVNLLANAIKFSPAGSTVRLSAEARPGAVEFTVSDRGRGIPAAKLGSIFERFQQVRSTDASEQGGSGLGLAICKALVELHGGDIRVESEEDRGSSFSFRIPSRSGSSAGTAVTLL